MSHSTITKTSRCQRGMAAVELAVILPVLMVLLTVPLFFARYFMHYTIAQKAAHDAVRYLSSVPKAEIYSMNSAFVEIDAAVFSKSLAYIEATEIPGARYIEAQCDGATCLGGSVPSRVRILVRIQYSDSVFPWFTSAYGGDQTRVITADVSMPYVGH